MPRFLRVFAIFLNVVAAAALFVEAVPAASAAPNAPVRAAAPKPADFGPEAARSADLAIDGWGDAQGYHLQVGRESSGFAWQEVALLHPHGFDASSWTGYQCLSGDGRFAALAILPADAVNVQAARDHGAFAYSVELASGAVRPLAGGVGLKYYSPGCGTGDEAVFTLDTGDNDQDTRLLSANLATGKIDASTTVPGQVTSAVPTANGIVGVAGSRLVSVPAKGNPVVLAPAGGDAYDLRPAADGGVSFLRVAPGAKTAEAVHEHGGVLTTLGSGDRTRLQLFQGRAGHAVLAGGTANTGIAAAAGVIGVKDNGLARGATAASLDGDALLGADSDGQKTTPVVLATKTAKVLAPAAAAATKTPATAVPAFAAVTASAAPAAKQSRLSPKGDAAAPAANAMAVPDTTTAQTPTCAVPPLDATRQVMQPSPAQVNWAAQMAEQGLLTGSAYTRPAGFANLGLVAYAPNSDFPLIPLSHPAGASSTVPRSVYEAIMAQESNWSQASWHAPAGTAGDPLIASYYGAGGDIRSINYAASDCGYGIGQVTDGMHVGDHSLSAHGQWKVAVDYQENIAAGLQILETAWNTLYGDGIIANNGDPAKLENWYFAAWAYNSGLQPNAANGNTTGCTPGPSCTGPDGTWGLGWTNNPANLDYPPNRDPYLQDTYADAAHPGSWPYQERVLGWMASPLLRYGSKAYAKPTYNGGNTWVQPAPFTAMCDLADNHCDPTTTNPANPGASHCMLNDFQCWWHQPVTWIPNCATTCATSPYAVSGGAEPSNPSQNPPTCNQDTSKVPAGSIIVDDQASRLNLQGCGASNWTSNGTFTYTYGTNSAGDPIGAIDTHQLGTGLGGHILFSHTEDGTEPALINTGTWTPNLPSLQYYKVKIHFPGLGAEATNVVYTINPGGGAAPWKFRVNQAWNSEQWATIGTFAMTNGANVVLTNQGSSLDRGGFGYSDFDVAFDAIAFVPMGGTPGQPIGGPPGILDAPKGSNPAWVNCGCVARTAGDPVDTATGYFGQTWTDLATPGRGEPLKFSRTYTESIADPNGPNKAAAADGPFGWGWTYSYNLSAVTDPGTGNVTIRQEDGSQVAFTDTNGSYAPAAPRYDATLTASGTNYVYTRRGQDFFTFDKATGHLTAEQDLAGTKANPQYSTTFAYDGAGHLHTITDAGGRSYTLTWTGNHITDLTDQTGREVGYGYDADGNLTDVYGVGTTRTPVVKDDDHARYTYTAAHLMSAMRSPDNFAAGASAVTAMTYDSAERVATQTDALGRTTTFTYGPAGGLAAGQTLTTDPGGHQTLDTYANGLLTAETKGYGTSAAGTWSYTYDPVTLGISTATDPDGTMTTYTYDDHGNRISESDGMGVTTNFLYDDHGNQIESIDGNGVATVNQFDQADHIPAGAAGVGDLTATTVTQANNVVESTTGNFGPAPARTVNYFYDDAAHPADRTRTADPLGHTTTLTYDTFGDKTSSTDPAGDKTTYGYDTGRGFLTSTVSPVGTAAGVQPGCVPPAEGCTTTAYDSYGDLVTTTDPLGHTTKATFDADGHKTSVTDANNRTTTYTFDSAGQQTKTTAADGTTASTDYNPDGSRTDVVDGLGHKTSFGYDGQGRGVSRTDPDNRTATSTLDPAGLLTKVVDQSGRTTTTTHDPVGRLTGVSYSDGTTHAVGYGYDPAGHRVSMTDGTGTTTWTYDVFGAVVAKKTGAGTTVAYGYDNAGEQTSLTYPGQTTAVSRTFDLAGRPATVTDWNGNKTTFGYRPDGRLATTAYPDGVTVTNGYDTTATLTSTTAATTAGAVSSAAYGRDPAGQLSSLTSGTTNQTFTYTDREQLKTSGSASFAYDGAGNPTTVGGVTQAFDPAGQLTTSGSTSYGFDNSGNRTSAGTATTYHYDQANRLTSFGGPAGTTSYGYDGAGLRATKTAGTTTTTFVWDDGGTPNLLSDGTTAFLYGPDGLPIEQTSAAGTSWFVHDQVGSTVALLNAAGAVAANYSYTPYGVATRTGTADTPLRYTGQYTDPESGLVYLRARYYDPATAQFLTVDPLVDQTGTPYAYVGGNPLNGTDFTGLCGFWCWVGVGAAVVGTAACIIAEPCGLVEGGVALGAGGAALAGGLTFEGGGVLATGLASGGLLGGAMHVAANSGSGNSSSSSGSSSSGEGGGGSPANSGVAKRPYSDIPGSSGCEEVADQIQGRIGGQLWEVKPPPGASNVGPYHGEDTFWGDHTFVVKDGWAYDQWTGPEGVPLQEFKEQFDYWDVLKFSPK